MDLPLAGVGEGGADEGAQDIPHLDEEGGGAGQVHQVPRPPTTTPHVTTAPSQLLLMLVMVF